MEKSVFTCPGLDVEIHNVNLYTALAFQSLEGTGFNVSSESCNSTRSSGLRNVTCPSSLNKFPGRPIFTRLIKPRINMHILDDAWRSETATTSERVIALSMIPELKSDKELPSSELVTSTADPSSILGLDFSVAGLFVGLYVFVVLLIICAALIIKRRSWGNRNAERSLHSNDVEMRELRPHENTTVFSFYERSILLNQNNNYHP